MTFKIILFILVGSLAIARAGGNDKGNGGFVISCENKQLLQTLDLFEAYDRDLKVIQFPETHTEIDIALEIAGRLRNISPERAASYSRQIRTFYYNSKVVDDSMDFSDVADIGFVYKPQGCEFIPTIIQKRSFVDTGVSFFINGKIWSKLSRLDKAALIMHEIVYLEFQHPVSALTRSFVGILFSVQAEILLKTPKNFLNLLEKHGAAYFEQKGVIIDLQKLYETNENFVITKAFVKEGVYRNGSISLTYGPEQVQFYSTGYPTFLRLQAGMESSFSVECMGSFGLRNKQDGKVHFHENGLIHKANFDPEKFKFAEYPCPSVRFEADKADIGAIELDHEQRLKMTSGLKAFYEFPEAQFNVRKEIYYENFMKPTEGWFDETTYFPQPDGSVFTATGGQSHQFRFFPFGF